MIDPGFGSEVHAMMVERRNGGELPVVAVLDDAETRALSRSHEAVGPWFRAARARLAWGPDTALVAAFPDDESLAAFLGRFLPGKLAAAGA